MAKQSKNHRTLDIYVRLCEGKIINKVKEAARFGVDERSIQRDIDDIRAFLEERSVDSKDVRIIEYNRAKNGFVMTGVEPSMMTNSEILAVSKILLESRAFTKRELKVIIDSLPTARVVEQYENECIIEAEVYGKGVIMWLLSQGKMLEILKPESLREEVKTILREMYERYL